MISRRNFLKVAGATAFAVAAAGMMTGCSGEYYPSYVEPIEGKTFEAKYPKVTLEYQEHNSVSIRNGADTVTATVYNVENYLETGCTFIAVQVAQKKGYAGAGNFKLYVNDKAYDALNNKGSFQYKSFMKYAIDATDGLAGHAAMGTSSWSKGGDIVCFLCPDEDVENAKIKFVYGWTTGGSTFNPNDDSANFDCMEFDAKVSE